MRTSSSILVLASLLAPVSLIAEERTADRNGSAPPAFEIKGRVVDDAGQPVVGAEVQVHGAGGGKSQPALTGDDGKFLFTLARAPSQFLQLRASSKDKTAQAFADYRIDARTALPAEFELISRPARKIDVTVVDVDDRPIVGAQVTIDGLWFPTATAEGPTDEAGRSLLLVPADEPVFSVAASKPGAGFDYVQYRGRRFLSASDPYLLPADQAQPIRLCLNGARPVTVRVVDEDGTPMPGVSVRPWSVEKPKKGGHLVMQGTVITDEHGEARFDTVPVDSMHPIRFRTEAKDYFTPERAMLEPGSDAAEIAVKLFKLLPIHGRVTFDDGRPAAGAEVKAVADGYATERFHGTTVTDQEGRFELAIYPNQFYTFAASLDRWVTPLASLVIRKAPPEDDIRLVLQKGTRIYGCVTIGRDRRPLGGQGLILSRSARDAYARLSEKDRLAATDRHIIQPSVSWSTDTDDQGAFEFFGGPGVCHLDSSTSGVPRMDFTISDEAELELNLHAERPGQEELSGRVVLKERPREGVVEVTVRGYSLDLHAPWNLETTSGVDGRFDVLRRTVNALLYARNELHKCFEENEQVAAALREHYVVVLIHVDLLGAKRHNTGVVERYGNPIQHGIPSLIVLDAEGKLLKTKDTDELENGDHHDPERVLAFLERWKP